MGSTVDEDAQDTTAACTGSFSKRLVLKENMPWGSLYAGRKPVTCKESKWVGNGQRIRKSKLGYVFNI